MPERRILVVEDTLLVAEAIADMLTAHGCTVVGPVGRLGPALQLARSEPLDGVLLDVNLAGQPCFPIATALQERGIPFLFLTGYDQGAPFPAAFRDVPRLPKPLDEATLYAAIDACFGS